MASKPAGIPTYFERVQPTYLEAWPPALCRLSIAQVDVPLTLPEAESLGRNIIELGETFVPKGQSWEEALERDRPVMAAIEKRLDQALAVFAFGGFVRLGSRSPKDVWFAPAHVESGKQALDRLCDCSERIWEDLRLAVAMQYPPHIFVRQWIDIEPWAEFRCFMQDRKLVGVSQYNYLHGAVYPEIAQHQQSIEWALQMWFPDFVAACHLDDVVFDIFVKLRTRGNETQTEIRLIEINPWGEFTDPCLFSWANGGDFDRSFRCNAEGPCDDDDFRRIFEPT